MIEDRGRSVQPTIEERVVSYELEILRRAGCICLAYRCFLEHKAKKENGERDSKFHRRDLQSRMERKNADCCQHASKLQATKLMKSGGLSECIPASLFRQGTYT